MVVFSIKSKDKVFSVAHLQNMFLLWFELIGLGDQKTLMCDLVDVCVIGCRAEGEVDHGIETLVEKKKAMDDNINQIQHSFEHLCTEGVLCVVRT